MRVIATAEAASKSSVKEALDKLMRELALEGCSCPVLQETDRVVGYDVLDANGVRFAPDRIVCKSKADAVEALIEEMSSIPAALAIAAGEINPNSLRARAAAEEQNRIFLAFPITIRLWAGEALPG